MSLHDDSVSIKSVTFEQRQQGEFKLFALTSADELVYFHVKQGTKNNDSFECKLTSVVKADSFKGVDSMTAIEGSLIF